MVEGLAWREQRALEGKRGTLAEQRAQSRGQIGVPRGMRGLQRCNRRERGRAQLLKE